MSVVSLSYFLRLYRSAGRGADDRPRLVVNKDMRGKPKEVSDARRACVDEFNKESTSDEYPPATRIDKG